MKSLLFVAAAMFFFAGGNTNAQTVRLDELNLSGMVSGWGTPEANRSVDGNPLKIHGVQYEHGVGTHAVSTFLLNLNGKGKRFTAAVGVDDETPAGKGSVEFYLIAGKEILWQSGLIKRGDSAKIVDVPLKGIDQLGLLVTDGGDGIDYDHADWADAKLELTETVSPDSLAGKPLAYAVAPYILTPPPLPTPKINGARTVGVRPGHPFLYTIAATGSRPMTFTAHNLPSGLTLDPATGIITGTVPSEGDYRVLLTATNTLGKTTRELRIIVGGQICLTPPMGWNSWNCWAGSVDDAKVRAAADAMVSTGLVNHGWTYINIDDCWMIKPDSTDSLARGPARDSNGLINANSKFPDMKALAEYVHGKGLKLGIYSSPGPLTCAGYTASYGNELHDAERFAEWGIDYLKYDWCSYDRIAPNHSLAELKKPYIVMRSALNKVNRDIVFSLCQYGMGNVWEWGAQVGGNCWRTTGDIVDTWQSMSTIGFGQAGHERYAGPGHWNDPDMLVVGKVGWGPELHPTRLTPDEQYTHISLWALLDAPLLIGCNLADVDSFTLSLLSNDEVLAINQDPLGRQASRIADKNGTQVWEKRMEDGSQAVGLFYAADRPITSPVDYFAAPPSSEANVVVTAKELGIEGRFRVRDVWRQKDLGVFTGQFETMVPYHGVVLIQVWPVR